MRLEGTSRIIWSNLSWQKLPPYSFEESVQSFVATSVLLHPLPYQLSHPLERGVFPQQRAVNFSILLEKLWWKLAGVGVKDLKRNRDQWQLLSSL